MVELTKKLISVDSQIDREDIEEEFGDVEVASRYIVVERDSGFQFYYEDSQPAPEGMSYEEDGKSTLRFEVGGSEVFYFDSDNERIEQTDAASLYYSFYDEGQEDLDLFVRGGDVEDVIERIVGAFSVVTEGLVSTYVYEDEGVHLDSDYRRYVIDDEGYSFEVGDDDVRVHTCNSQEEVEKKVEEFSERLRGDEDWPPEVERYKYVDTLDEEIGEVEGDRFEEVEGVASDREDTPDVVYFSILGKGKVGFNRSHGIVAGISYESMDEARESLEVFVEDNGVGLECASFGIVEFEDYEY